MLLDCPVDNLVFSLMKFLLALDFESFDLTDLNGAYKRGLVSSCECVFVFVFAFVCINGALR